MEVLYLLMLCLIVFNPSYVKTDESLSPAIEIISHDFSDSSTPEDIAFYVNETVKIFEGDVLTIYWSSTVKNAHSIQIFLKDNFTAEISDSEEFFNIQNDAKNDEYLPINFTLDDVTAYGYVNLTGKFVGYNTLTVTIYDANNQKVGNGDLNIAILLRKFFLSKIYSICLTLVLISVYTTMGANLDLELVKRIAKQPVGPLIGLFCQYGCMPLIAFGLGLIVFPNDPLLRLGLFASGSAPGGGLSNMWTHLLGGSLDLSIMMTFASTVVALGAVPFWLLIMGPVIVQGADFVIPYTNVIFGIFLLIIPCFIGILIQLKLPKLTKIFQMIITPLSILNIIFIFTFGLYANFYLFSYISWQAVLGGFGQSICGHLAGIIFAVLFRRNLEDIIAISIETAVQNNGIAFLLLKLSLESPAGDIAVLMPGCVTLFMPIPLAIACLIRAGYVKWFKKVDPVENNVNEGSVVVIGLDNPALKIEYDTT